MGLLLACLLLAPLAPAAGAEGGTIRQSILVEVATDRTEALTWEVVGEGSLPAGATLPNGSRVLGVTYAGARVPFTATEDANGSVLVRPNLSVSHFVVQATRAAPGDATQPLYASSLAVVAYPEVANEIRVEVRVPPGHALFWISEGTVDANATRASGASTRAGWWTFAYRAPLEPSAGLVEIDEGIYHLIGPRASEEVMRRVARVASEGAAPALAQVGLTAKPPYWVRYAPSQVFGWEEGAYGNDGIIALRKSLLANDSSVGFPWAAAEALVHETFHAATLPRGPAARSGDLSWWIEGSARYAERFVGGDDGWRACDDPWCWTFRSQILASDLEARYASDWRFDPRWDPATSAEGRGIEYQYAGFLVASFVARYGDAAYAAAWSEVRTAAEDPACACGEAWLRSLLVRLSGGRLSVEELYHPYRELAADEPAAFAQAVAPLVANAPHEGAPVPMRLAAARPPVPPAATGAPDAPAWRPALRFVADEPPHRAAWATVVLLDLADLEVNRTSSAPGGPPAARLFWTLDGAPVAPNVRVEGARLVATFDRVKAGPHNVSVEAIPVAGVEFDPPVVDALAFALPTTYEISFVDPWEVEIRAPTTLVVSLRDGVDAAPLARRPLLLAADGIPIRVALTDAEGIARFLLEGAAPGLLRLALTLEDDPDAQGARAERTYEVGAPRAEPVVRGAVYEPPQEARVPGGALGLALACVALAARLRTRREG